MRSTRVAGIDGGIVMTYDRDMETPCPVCGKMADCFTIRCHGRCALCVAIAEDEHESEADDAE